MELLLINHPLDCPICDKGGECPLQNQAMSTGRTDSRFVDEKRTFPKPMPISTQVLLDRERCVLCQRCTRFSEQIAGDPFIDLLERGAQQQIGVAQDKPFQSYFSGNTIQICPVGALTSAAYRFRSRPFDLVSTPGVCEHCACGCADAHRLPARHGACAGWPATTPRSTRSGSATRAASRSATSRRKGRITRPLVRGGDGVLAEASWTEALRVAAEGLLAARNAGGALDDTARGEGGIGVLAGGRLTVEDAYAYAKFARVAAGTNDVDFRARPHSRRGAGLPRRARRRPGPRAAELHAARGRARGAVRGAGARGGGADRLPAAAQGRAEAPAEGLPPRPVDHPGRAADGRRARLRRACRPRRPDPRGAGRRGGGARRPGERRPARRRGPHRRGRDPRRRAGRRGAGPVHGGRPARRAHRRRCRLGAAAGRGARRARGRRRCPPCCPAAARSPTPPRAPRSSGPGASADGTLPATPGRDTDEILDAAAAGELAALVVGGVDPHDLPDPAAALAGAARGRLPGQPGAAHVARSPSWPTSCSRWPRTRSGPAATSTGRAAAASSGPRSTPAACCRTAGCSTPWPSRWTSTCSPRPRRPRPASWPGWAPYAGVAAGPSVAPRPSRCGRSLRAGGARDLAAAARRVLARRRRARAGRHRPARRSCGSTRPRPSGSA